MAPEKRASRRSAQFLTEDWVAVVVGLRIVVLVLAGVLKHIP